MNTKREYEHRSLVKVNKLKVGGAVALLLLLPVAAWAGGVVTNCTEAALRAAMAGGGAVTFACEGTITLASTITNVSDTTLDGSGHQVTISGGGSVRVFYVAASLTLIHLTIRDGQSSEGTSGMQDSPGHATAGGPGDPGGGIYNADTLILRDCVVTANRTGNGGLGYSGPEWSGVCSAGGPGGSGGGIYNAGTLTLSNCMVSGNSTGYGGSSGGFWAFRYLVGGDGGMGAGIYNAGTLRLDDSTVNGNRAGNGAGGRPEVRGANGGAGGGIWSSGNLTANGCTFSGNSSGAGGTGGNSDDIAGAGGAGGPGGAICGMGSLALANCTLVGNSAGLGGTGGVHYTTWPPYFSYGASGGQGGSGGGIYSQGNLDLINCTIAANQAGSGGAEGPGTAGNGPSGPVGVGGGVTNASGTARLLNTIVALNTGNAADVSGEFTSLGHNLIGATNGSGGFPGAGDRVGSSASPLDPRVGPLADNGGPTFTLALLPGSPALDSGTVIGAPPTDQRGVPRPQAAGVDIGAFEYQYTIPVISGPAFQGPDSCLRCFGLPGRTYTVQASTNLLNWSDLNSVISGTNGLFDYVDTAQINRARRFYRLKCTAP